MNKNFKLKKAECILERPAKHNYYTILEKEVEKTTEPNTEDYNEVIENLLKVLSSRIIDDGNGGDLFNSGRYKQISTKLYETELIKDIHSVLKKFYRAVATNKSFDKTIIFNVFRPDLKVTVDSINSTNSDIETISTKITHSYISRISFKFKKGKRKTKFTFDDGSGEIRFIWYGYCNDNIHIDENNQVINEDDEEDDGDYHCNSVPKGQIFKKCDTKIEFYKCENLEQIISAFSDAMELAMQMEPVNAVSDIRGEYTESAVQDLLFNENAELDKIETHNISDTDSNRLNRVVLGANKYRKDEDQERNNLIVENKAAINGSTKKFDGGVFENSLERLDMTVYTADVFITDMLNIKIPISTDANPTDIKYRTVQDIFRRKKVSVYDNLMWSLHMLHMFAAEPLLNYSLELGTFYKTAWEGEIKDINNNIIEKDVKNFKYSSYIHFDFTCDGNLMIVISYYTFDESKKFGVLLNKLRYSITSTKDLNRLINSLVKKVK